jgi:hypothetical protein
MLKKDDFDLSEMDIAFEKTITVKDNRSTKQNAQSESSGQGGYD